MKTRKVVRVNAAELFRQLNGLQTRVGWFESAKYPDGVPVALVATVHEHGAPDKGIPPRPFFQPAIDANTPDWRKTIADGTKAMLDGRVQPVQIMEAVGLQAQGDLKRAIIAVNDPALAESTIRARKRAAIGARKEGESRADYSARVDDASVSTKVLNDSGHMLATVLTQTEKKGT